MSLTLTLLLDDEQMEVIVRAAAEMVLTRTLRESATSGSAWLDSRAAAQYLGMTRNALHKLTARRQIPFEQDGPGCKLWFQRTRLDRWRAGGSDSVAP